MARIGVSYSEVADAATQLKGQGRNPTVEQVRLVLGTGSSSTIANHLRQWKANQDTTSQISLKENIPDELVAVMKGLWGRVVNHSDERIDKVETDYKRTIAELQLELDKYKANNQRWQKLYEQWITEKDNLSQEKHTLEQALEFSQRENTTLNSKINTNVEQLKERQLRIDELKRLNEQTQANLEHYRESTREQRLLDQQKHDQQIQVLQLEITTLSEQAKSHREKIISTQQQYKSLEEIHLQLEKTNNQLQSNLEENRIKLAIVEKLNKEYQNSNNNLQNQIESYKDDQKNKTSMLLDTQTENKIMLQKLSDINVLLADREKVIKSLSQEKWEINQERAVLEGQLKQLQKAVPA